MPGSLVGGLDSDPGDTVRDGDLDDDPSVQPAAEPDVPPIPGAVPAFLARNVVQPIQDFLEIEAAGGLLLAAATLIAIVWANSPFEASYSTLWHTEIGVSLGRWGGTTTLQHFVDDGLMAVFFFVIGLEIKREWLFGELRDRRAAVLPIVAALGGMAVPALLFIVIAGSTQASHGWGIPMATDIAFVVGIMALLGSRVPSPLKVFLLTLAIVDDLGAIVVIAVFYAGSLKWGYLAVAVIGLVVVLGMRWLGIRWFPAYVFVALVVWYATLLSGVHATIAGVALAFCTPATPLTARGVRLKDATSPDGSPLQKLEDALHPWVSFVIVPVFALANAGVVISGSVGPEGFRVIAGIAIGLVVGKAVGVTGTSWLVVRLGLARRPEGVSWLQMLGAGLLAGIGFTMSLFVTDLAFKYSPETEELVTLAKEGVLLASIIAAVLGAGVLVLAGRGRSGPGTANEDGEAVAVGETGT